MADSPERFKAALEALLQPVPRTDTAWKFGPYSARYVPSQERRRLAEWIVCEGNQDLLRIRHPTAASYKKVAAKLLEVASDEQLSEGIKAVGATTLIIPKGADPREEDILRSFQLGDTVFTQYTEGPCLVLAILKVNVLLQKHTGQTLELPYHAAAWPAPVELFMELEDEHYKRQV